MSDDASILTCLTTSRLIWLAALIASENAIRRCTGARRAPSPPRHPHRPRPPAPQGRGGRPCPGDISENVHPNRPIPGKRSVHPLGVPHRRDDLHRPAARPEARPELRWADLSERETQVLDSADHERERRRPGRRPRGPGARPQAPRPAQARGPARDPVPGPRPEEHRRISALTGWNQTLVKVRAFRARRKLQRFYRELTESERL
jgi:hypothetical protein